MTKTGQSTAQPPSESAARSRRPPVIAVLNSNDDLVEMLGSLLGKIGYAVVSGHIDDVKRGRMDLLNFIRQHDPQVIVYDLVPPYDRSWDFLLTVKESEYMRGRTFILTSVNAARAQEVVGMSDMVYEVVGKGEDLDRIVTAIREAVHRR